MTASDLLDDEGEDSFFPLSNEQLISVPPPIFIALHRIFAIRQQSVQSPIASKKKLSSS
jgi:hypothetical protein